MAEFRGSLDVFFNVAMAGAQATPATVTPVGGSPISTAVIVNPAGRADMQIQASAVVVDAHPTISLRRDQVPDLPPGSTIVAAPYPGAAAKTFRVTRIDRAEEDVLTVAVA
jgi:hypothetical protein